jgi:hypothetical protein
VSEREGVAGVPGRGELVINDVRVIWLTLLEQDKLRIRLAVPLFAWHDSYLDLDESRPCLAASDNKALLQV